MSRASIFLDIERERTRQDSLKAEGKFDSTCADPIGEYKRLAILSEEVGEVARCLVEGDAVSLVRGELIQIAAVAVAWIEGLDRESER